MPRRRRKGEKHRERQNEQSDEASGHGELLFLILRAVSCAGFEGDGFTRSSRRGGEKKPGIYRTARRRPGSGVGSGRMRRKARETPPKAGSFAGWTRVSPNWPRVVIDAAAAP